MGIAWRGTTAVGTGGSATLRTGTPPGRSPWIGRTISPTTQRLLLTNLDPAQDRNLLGCYQPLAKGPNAGAIIVLRYRARAQHGTGSLAVYVALPVVIPESDKGAAASRIRDLGRPLPPEPDDPVTNRWLYQSLALVTPTNEWQTYLQISECPPFPARGVHRNLVIDVVGSGQIWVDDVELFVWQPGSES